jgi:membrane protease YdiL (CAAX protease family)
MSYGAASPFAIGGTIVGNSVVGVLYGWSYWRRSLVAAMVAHFAVDVVLHVLPAFVR